MQLLELSFQGVRGFGPQVRVQLQPGYWVLQPALGGTPPLGALLSALFYADGRGSDASFSAPGAAESTAGLMLQGKDGQTYWLVRTLGRAGALHRYVPATQQFDPVSSDATEMGQVLRNQLGAPSKPTLEGLFVFTLGQLPTHRPRTPGSPARAMTPALPQLAAAMPVLAATDIADARRKLAALEQERALAEEVEKLQYQADGLASRAFALESQLKSTEALQAQVQEARTALEAAPTAQSLGLPGDILHRVEQYPKLIARRDESLAKLEAERGGQEEGDAPARTRDPALHTDPRFIASAALGVLALGAGWVVHTALRYVALFDIPAFGVAALLALRHLDAREEGERGQRRGSRRADREQRILEQFDADSAPLRTALQQLNLDKPAAITELLSQRAPLQEIHERVRQQLEALEASPEQARARGDLAEVKAQQAKLEAALTEKGSYVRDGREVEREMARLEESIALAEKPRAPVAVAAAPVAATANALPDPTPALLALASDLFTTDATSAANLIRERALVYLTAFSDRRLTALDIDTHGRAFVTGPQGRAPAEELAGSDLDLLYLALRIAVVEKYCAKQKAPIIVEDVMAGVDLPRLPIMAKALKGLSRLTQVLHVTERPEFVALADGKAAL